MNKLLERIKQLSDLPGVSGCEDPVREAILAMVKDHCDSWKVDALGNLLVFKKGEKRPKNTLMLSAHMDEVGFIITHIEEDGLLRFAAVGGIDPRVVTGKSVEIGPNRLYGVVGSKPVHLHSDREKDEVPQLEALFIDIGAGSREEAAQHVSPGDRAIFYAPFFEMGDHCILGRAFDDRAGCALLVELIRSPLPYDCNFAFTVQEETGCTGATTAGYTVAPDISIVVETTTAADVAGVPDDRKVCKLGEGPVVSYMDRGTIYDTEMYALAFEVAKREGIPCQTKTMVAGGNEARSIQIAGEGVRVMAVSLPCRYLHSPSNVLHKEDVASTHKLLAALIRELGDYRN